MLRDRYGSIDYSEEGAGPTIVFVPGSWATGSAWRSVIAGLSGRFRTVTTSLSGYGGTRDRRTAADTTIDRQAEIVEAVIRHAGAPVAIHSALEASDYKRANELIAVMLDFEEIRAEEQSGTNVTVVKTALQLIGIDCGPTRPPSAWPLTDVQMARLRKLLEGWKAISASDRRASKLLEGGRPWPGLSDRGCGMSFPGCRFA